MSYYSQEKNYTCGCACFRMVLSEFLGKSKIPYEIVPDELYLEKEMNTSMENTGTHYKDMMRIGRNYGLHVKEGVDGNLDDLDKLREEGWVVVLGISLDVPHFVIYLGNNGNHIFMDDPFRGANSNFQVNKFLRNHWDINHKKYKILETDYPDLVFDPKMNRKGYWIAYRNKI